MDKVAITSYQTLDQLSRHCPEAVSTYVTCLARVDVSGSLLMSKDEIKDDLCESWVKFRNHLKLLSKEGVLEFHIMNDMVRVTLAEDGNGGD